MTETDVLNYFTYTGPVFPPGLKDSKLLQFHTEPLYIQNRHHKNWWKYNTQQSEINKQCNGNSFFMLHLVGHDLFLPVWPYVVENGVKIWFSQVREKHFLSETYCSVSPLNCNFSRCPKQWDNGWKFVPLRGLKNDIWKAQLVISGYAGWSTDIRFQQMISLKIVPMKSDHRSVDCPELAGQCHSKDKHHLKENCHSDVSFYWCDGADVKPRRVRPEASARLETTSEWKT